MENPSCTPPPPPPLKAVDKPKTSRPQPGDQLICFDTPDHEVRYACRKILAEDTSSDDIFISCYAAVPSVLQYDKVCGLVALEMALSLSSFSVHPKTEDLLKLAKERKFTVQGEMFSADNLAELATEVGTKSAVVEENAFVNKSFLLEHIARGRPVLLPYDIGVDNLPTCLSGRKAHWAVISGAVIQVSRQCIQHDLYRRDEKISNLLHFSCKDGLNFQEKDASRIYLLGKQGKSRYLGAWLWESLAESNANLKELPSFIIENPTDYVIPDGGVAKGLGSKLVLLSPDSVKQ